MAECKQCGGGYEAKRSTSSYCSPKCKQEFYRNRMAKPVTLRDAKPVTVTNGKSYSISTPTGPSYSGSLPAGYKTAAELAPGEYNRVSKPGDPDYEPQCGLSRTSSTKGARL